MAKANHPVEKVRTLQRALYVAAKQRRTRRFHALYDRIARPDVLQAAWEQVRSNRGAAGIDGETLEAIETYGGGADARRTARTADDRALPAASGSKGLHPKARAPPRTTWIGHSNSPGIEPVRPGRVRFRTRSSSLIRSTRWPARDCRSSSNGAARGRSGSSSAREVKRGG